VILHGLFDPSDSIIYLLFSITKVLQHQASCLPFSNLWSVVVRSLLTLHQFTIVIHTPLCIYFLCPLDYHCHIVYSFAVIIWFPVQTSKNKLIVIRGQDPFVVSYLKYIQPGHSPSCQIACLLHSHFAIWHTWWTRLSSKKHCMSWYINILNNITRHFSCSKLNKYINSLFILSFKHQNSLKTYMHFQMSHTMTMSS
jgi:hypothetical protein